MKISIFFSHPEPINDQQRKFVEQVREWADARDLLPLRLGSSDYSLETPLEAIRGLMAQCNGLLCIAFRRTHIGQGQRTVLQSRKYVAQDISDIWYTSPWCHIEPAMAYQVGLPLLVLRESKVVQEGVLELGMIGAFMPEFELDDGEGLGHYLDSKEWRNLSQQWFQRVHSVVSNKGKAPRLY